MFSVKVKFLKRFYFGKDEILVSKLEKWQMTNFPRDLELVCQISVFSLLSNHLVV